MPEALRDLGVDVKIHDEHFAPDTPDEEWLRVVSARGWFVLTGDKRIPRSPLAVAVIRSSSAAVFIVAMKDRTGPKMAEVVTKHLQRMVNLAASRRRPFIARVLPSGVDVVKTALS